MLFRNFHLVLQFFLCQQLPFVCVWHKEIFSLRKRHPDNCFVSCRCCLCHLTKCIGEYHPDILSHSIQFVQSFRLDVYGWRRDAQSSYAISITLNVFVFISFVCVSSFPFSCADSLEQQFKSNEKRDHFKWNWKYFSVSLIFSKCSHHM